jgi:5-oxopent-3-ene-1,2,5-tricarboxylate decarboxylase / 2-hydroxyhepta-2,4-diene-1,7-dioate isomerase
MSTTPSRIGRVQRKGETLWVTPEATGQLRVLSGEQPDQLEKTDRCIAEDEVVFLPPVEPTKLLGIGANFPGEKSPGRDPSFFLMAPSAMAGHQQDVKLPPAFGSVLAEGELGVVIGRRAQALSEDEVFDYILGFTIVNDFSGRDATIDPVPAAAKKSSDGFAPIGPYLLINSERQHFDIETYRNGELVQEGNTKDLRFSIEASLAHITAIMTLERFDVIAMGTPAPKPKLVAGDVVSVKISDIGALTNKIIS